MLTIFRRINALCEPPLHHPHQLASPLLQHPVSVTETLAAYPISPYIWVSKGNCLSLSPRISRSPWDFLGKSTGVGPCIMRKALFYTNFKAKETQTHAVQELA